MKTRMERYKELRERLSSEVDQNIANHDLSRYANRLNKIDEDHFEDMNQHSDPNYEPSRAKDVDLKKYETFENEYLKDFLDEVKSYNIEKGHRYVDDTEQNILEEIQAQSKDNIPLGTKEAPIGYEELDLLAKEEDAKKEEQNESVSSDHQVLEETIKELKEEDFEMEDLELDTVDETPIDTDALINSLQEGNFVSEKDEEDADEDIFANLKTFDLDEKQEHQKKTEAILKESSDDEALKLQELEEKVDESDESYDPFWEDYIQKMNELEDKEEDPYTANRDSLNFPENRVKKFEVEEPQEEERDITQEFLALTREIEKDDLKSSAEEEVSEIPENEVVESNDHLNDEESETAVVVGSDTNKNRFVNAILTVALAGIILGIAVAVKYFFLNN